MKTNFLFLILVFFGMQLNAEVILQGAVMAEASPQPTHFHSDKIQPGQDVKLSVLVENKGSTASPDSQIVVRFGLTTPLHNEKGSVLFETEKLSLPPIQPDGKVEITFEKMHQWPSLPDFIRDDWGLREYQAIIWDKDEEKLIGTLAITYSAYYYPGIRKEFPTKI